MRVYLNNLNLPPPPPPAFASYAAQLILGTDPLRVVDPVAAFASVQSWVASLTELLPFAVPLAAKSAGNLSFTIPAGFGPSQGALVLVDGIPSNIVNFS